MIIRIDIDAYYYDVTATMLNNVNEKVKVSLKVFFNWLRSNGLIKINPVKIKKYKKKLSYVANQDDIDKINANEKLTEQDKLLVFIAQSTGARISEIVTLCMCNITDTSISFVTHEVKGKEVLQTKNGIGRTIRVHKDVVDKIKSNYISNDNGYIFWNEKLSKRMTEKNFRYKFNKFANFSKFHSFRHRAISEWVQAGVDLVKISKVVGHHCPSYTLKQYSHLIYAIDPMPRI